MAIDINGDGLIQLGGTSTTQGRVRLNEDTDNGTNYIEITAPASVTSNKTITMPDETGTVITTATTTGINASAISTGTLAVANGGTGANTLTSEAVIIGNSTSAVKFVAPGTSGNVLSSNGTAWLSVAPATGANTQSFTSSGTWTKPSGATMVMVLCWGAGGSGGRGFSGGSGGGGGGGELTTVLIPAVLLPSTVTVTIGAGGTSPATNVSGNQGGSTTFGTYSDAVGGFGGNGGQSTGSTGGAGGGRYLCAAYYDGVAGGTIALVSCGLGGIIAGAGYSGILGAAPTIRSTGNPTLLAGSGYFVNNSSSGTTSAGTPDTLKSYGLTDTIPFTQFFSYGGGGGGGGNGGATAGGNGANGLLAGAGAGGCSDTGTGGTGGTSSQITSFSGFTSVGGNGGTNGGAPTAGSGIGAGGGGAENQTAGSGSNGACIVYSW